MRPTYNFWKRNGGFHGTLSSTNPKEAKVLGFDAATYLVGSGKQCVSTVVANSSCTSHHFTPFWRGRRTIFVREMAVSAVRFTLQNPKEAKYELSCCSVVDGIMEKMYQHCCCSFALHKPPLHPSLARPAYNFCTTNGRFRGTLYITKPQGSQV